MAKIKGFFAFALLTSQLLLADRCNCQEPLGYGAIETSAGLLYLRPSLCRLDFAIQDPSSSEANASEALPKGQGRSFHPEYELGVRAAIGYGSRCGSTDARIQYTYLHTRHINRAVPPPYTGGSLWPTLAHPRYLSTLPPLFNGTIPAFDRTKSIFDYDAVDLQLAISCRIKRCLTLRSYSGLHFLNLDHDLTQNIQGVVPESPIGNQLELFDFWQDNRGFWGIGPLFGCDSTLRFHRSLAFTTHLAIALLTGEERWRRIEQTTVQEGMTILIDQPLNVRQGEKSCLIPYLRGSIGVAYCFTIPWAYQLTAEISYEFHSYINGSGLFRFNDERATGSMNRKSFNLDGIVLMVRLLV